MQAYIARRLLLSIPTIVLISFISFGALALIPGSVVAVMAGDLGYAGDQQELEALLGLDKPFYEQYIDWMGGVLQGDFGTSLWTGRTAMEDFQIRLPVTLELTVMALTVAALVGIPVGALSAIRQDTSVDYLGRGLALVLVAVPNFWIAVLVVLLPAYYWGWTPVTTYVPIEEDPLENIRILALPAAILGIQLSGAVMRVTRTAVLDVVRQDHVRTAQAKGLSSFVVSSRHVLRNSLVPIITIVGLQVPTLLGGSIVIEQIFGIPGVGQMTINALEKRDFPIIAAINLVFATSVILVNLAVDLTYAVLDPRIRLQ